MRELVKRIVQLIEEVLIWIGLLDERSHTVLLVGVGTPYGNHTTELYRLRVGGIRPRWLRGTGHFEPGPNLVHARHSHTATRLADGRVLVTGGFETGAVTDTAEIYDPATGAFAMTPGLMTVARANHTATELFDGKVLITGGHGFDGVAVASAEIFDPATGTFAATSGPMTTPRRRHTALAIIAERVLIVGGYDQADAPLASAEWFDVATSTFSPATPATPGTPRADHGAARSYTGSARAFLAGGTGADEQVLASAENFKQADDSAAGQFVFTPTPMATPRRYHTVTNLTVPATTLPDSDYRILIAGGTNNQGAALDTAELFDPLAETFTPVGNMGVPRKNHTATLLPNGWVLIAGGEDDNGHLNSAEIYDPIRQEFLFTDGPMLVARTLHTGTPLYRY